MPRYLVKYRLSDGAANEFVKAEDIQSASKEVRRRTRLRGYLIRESI